MRARHRLSKLLLRHGIVYYDGNAWTGKHDLWLRHDALGQLGTPATRLAFDSDYESVLAVKARRDRLDVAIAQMAADSQFTPLVHRLGCLRGIGTLTGFALAVEIGDWDRFTGNTHARRLLVEAAGHHRPEYRIGKTMPERWELAPAAARIRGDEGNRGLHHRWVKFIGRQKKSTIANVAVARELVGWCWSLAMIED